MWVVQQRCCSDPYWFQLSEGEMPEALLERLEIAHAAMQRHAFDLQLVPDCCRALLLGYQPVHAHTDMPVCAQTCTCFHVSPAGEDWLQICTDVHTQIGACIYRYAHVRLDLRLDLYPVLGACLLKG